MPSRINRIREAGLIKRWKEVFWPRNDECDLKGSGDANVIKVFLGDMQGSFYILGMGKHLTLMLPVWFITATSNFRLVCPLEFPYMVHATSLI